MEDKISKGKAIKSGRRAVTYNLYNKKILFLGTGDIAKEAARLANFKMEIIGFNTRGKGGRDHFDRCVSLENLEETLVEADYVVMVLPLTKSTYKFMDKEKFDAMKEPCSSTGRGTKRWLKSSDDAEGQTERSGAGCI